MRVLSFSILAIGLSLCLSGTGKAFQSVAPQPNRFIVWGLDSNPRSLRSFKPRCLHDQDSCAKSRSANAQGAEARLGGPAVIESTKSEVARLLRDGVIQKAEQVVNFETQSLQICTPDDPFIIHQFALNLHRLPEAWAYQTGSASNTAVYIIDTAVDITHPDLNIPVANTIDLLHPGQVQVLGRDVHATHVAGIIGARGNNGFGVAGLNWNSNIYSVKVCEFIYCPTDAIIAGIYFVADHNPGPGVKKVINMSLSGRYFSPALRDAVAYAVAKDVVIVTAAGNQSQPTILYYPASFPGVLSVGAIDSQGGLAYFSNHTADQTSIVAAGVGVLSSVPESVPLPPGIGDALSEDSRFAFMNGTSMASPVVAGSVALARAAWPAGTGRQISLLVQRTGRRTQPMWPDAASYRILDTGKLVEISHGLGLQFPEGDPSYLFRGAMNSRKASVKAESARIYYGLADRIVHVEGLASERDFESTRIRWFISEGDESSAQYPQTAHYVETCPSLDVDGSNAAEPENLRRTIEPRPRRPLCRDRKFAFDFRLRLPSGNQDPQTNFYLSGVIEDRDSQGDIISLEPVKFSDGTELLNLIDHFNYK